jgi:hypothetical protein
VRSLSVLQRARNADHDGNSHRNGDPDSHTDDHRDRNGHGDCDTHHDSNSDPNCNRYVDRDANVDHDCNGYSDRDADTDSRFDGIGAVRARRRERTGIRATTCLAGPSDRECASFCP